ncbi:V-type ATP synthase subunit I [Peptoniphilus mikwangii]|uniref:V-type ATP synthase subunit I n=1 Tax=Peptoniphilus mikwangii TaxID=1354300 RepID=UPI00040A9FE7|nr:V-type ATPase 116kDa subunit family protein [Peptoniphilus mikwangii]
MAVEKMKMMDVVGQLSDMDSIIVDVLKTKAVNIVNTRLEIDNNFFTFSLEDENNLERNMELNYIQPFEKDSLRELNVKRAKELMNFFGIDSIDEKYVKDVDMNADFDSFYDKLKTKIDRLEKINEDLKIISGIKNNYELFKNVNVNLSDLANLKYFKARFGILDKDGRFRLKKNYGNILAMIFHTGTINENEVYLALYPQEVSNEIDRILKSLNWQDVNILGKYCGTAQEIFEKLMSEHEILVGEKKEIENFRNSLIQNEEDRVKRYIAGMLLAEKIEDVKKYMAKSKKYFYMSGWIGVSDVENIKSVFSKYDNIDVNFRDPEKGESIPTKLVNANFFKPFELLLKMYGTPGYNESDPTVFFGITYMILFGAMFGDLGQGAIFFLLGLYIGKRGNKGYGAILSRLGASSMIFGVLYGSVFGNEELIPAMWMKPFESINDVLAGAIVFGIGLLFVSYVIGFINRIKVKDYEDAFFGKDGLCGFAIFLLAINLGLSAIKNISIVPKKLTLILIVVALVLMIFKRPITQLLKGEKISYEDGNMSGYYIEGVFLLLEALMSILSNIISFIRVGAFAINHVGLFMAFQTVGKMINNSAGNFVILVIGNLVIIGLEGLLVFIQSLRLEYYEMFSKYYLGDGYEFIADKIELKEF